ncbi:MAG: hypothetical protein COB24_12420 [Hyphomicrobiales bacterium]|nr:MAG: hypothetical protein COB24_12420 [Hyphomicrobiales bacterium]
MSDNMKLIQYFVKGCISNETEKLGNLVSPKFVYVLNLDEYFDWEEFVVRNRTLHHTTNIVIHEISSEDDVHFHYDFDISLPEPNLEIAARGFIQIIVKGGLITRIDAHTNNTEEEFKTFQELREKSSTILL